MASSKRIVPSVALLTVSSVLLFVGLKPAVELGRAKDDPARLVDLRLPSVATKERVGSEIDQALRDGDTDLADSFVELADARSIPVDADRRVTIKKAEAFSFRRSASEIWKGLSTGETDTIEGNAAALVGDVTGIGDARDLWQQGSLAAKGQPIDKLTVALSTAGLALTVATLTPAALAAGPSHEGLAIVKTAKRVGRISPALLASLQRLVGTSIEMPALRRAASAARSADPPAVRKAAVEIIKPGTLAELRTLGRDVFTVERKIGKKGTLQVLEMAQNTKEIGRARRLVDVMGHRTRAVLKLLGKSALAVGGFSTLMIMQIAGSISLWLASLPFAVAPVLWKAVRRSRPATLSPV